MEEGKGKFIDACRVRLFYELGRIAKQKVIRSDSKFLQTPAAQQLGAEIQAVTLLRIKANDDRWKYAFAVQAFDPLSNAKTGLGREEIAVSNREMFVAGLKTTLKLLFASTAITEYLLPFLFALAPLGVLPFLYC